MPVPEGRRRGGGEKAGRGGIAERGRRFRLKAAS